MRAMGLLLEDSRRRGGKACYVGGQLPGDPGKWWLDGLSNGGLDGML